MDATAFSAATLSDANDLALFRQIFSANDLVFGTGANDVFALGRGGDVYGEGGGQDRVDGGTGDDIIVGDNSNTGLSTDTLLSNAEPTALDLDLHRFRSDQVLNLCGPLFESHGGFPAESRVFAARVAETVEVFRCPTLVCLQTMKGHFWFGPLAVTSSCRRFGAMVKV